MRISTVHGRRVAAVLAAAGALLGGLGTAQDASAATTSGVQCRTQGFASEPDGVSELPCAQGDGGRGVIAAATFNNPNHVSIRPCAQVLLVNGNGTTTQVNSYGCNSGPSSNSTVTLNTSLKDIGLSADGTYVVQVGFYVGSTYVTGAQSGRVAVYG